MSSQAEYSEPALAGRAAFVAIDSPRARVQALAWVSAVVAATRELWHRQTLRAKLVAITLAIQTMAGVVAGGIIIVNARTATMVETDASFRQAGVLIDDAVRLVRDDRPVTGVLETLPLQLRALRHVRIAVFDSTGIEVANAAGRDARAAHERAPAWFHALIATPVRTRTIPVVAQGQPVGTVMLTSEPADEIAEVWSDTLMLGLVAIAVNVAILGALYVLFGRALAPVAGFARALGDLERHDYSVRLPLPRSLEFAALTARFNILAETLAAARDHNLALTRRLISAQDDERQRTAMELHDEVGPCLFGLRAAATSLAGCEGSSAAVSERARDMLAIIERLQIVNRSLLNRLRPMALGHVPLRELVGQILRDRGREHAHITLTLEAPRLAAAYGDAVDLTIYRCVQESLTNAIRHGGAARVRVGLEEVVTRLATGKDMHSELRLCVEDDGIGISEDSPWGFGLRGMQERVAALGGDLSIARRSDGGGTVVRAAIPLAAMAGPGNGAP
jgi:two-component system, NarL family, sensor histidine kinase UhpB